VRALLAIRQPKTIVEAGKWHSGKMPRSAFPLSKSHSYALGSGWDWSVCVLESDDNRYKLLVAFDPFKEQYRAWLGLESGSDLALLARLEFHPSHKGWHLHRKNGRVQDIARGVVKEQRGRDRSRNCAAPPTFTVSQLDALSMAFRVFNVSRLPPEPWGLFG
jgi:hypothetical protein